LIEGLVKEDEIASKSNE